MDHVLQVSIFGISGCLDNVHHVFWNARPSPLTAEIQKSARLFLINANAEELRLPCYQDTDHTYSVSCWKAVTVKWMDVEAENRPASQTAAAVFASYLSAVKCIPIVTAASSFAARECLCAPAL